MESDDGKADGYSSKTTKLWEELLLVKNIYGSLL